MRKLFRLIPLPLVVLGSFLSIFITIATPSQAEAIVCPTGQVAVETGGAQRFASGGIGQCVIETPRGTEGVTDCQEDEVNVINGSGDYNCHPRISDNEQHTRCTVGTRGVRVGPGTNGVGGSGGGYRDQEECETIMNREDNPAAWEECLAISDGHAPVDVGGGRHECLVNIQWQHDNPETVNPPGGNPAGPGGTGGPGADGEGSPEVESTCKVKGVGWIVCPAMHFLADIMDHAFAFLAEHFLVIQTGLVSSPDVTQVWGSFRSIANGLFIILFLVIIFSQVSNLGISNYGIKKLLPKVLVTAVLINMSLIISQIAVDLSNIGGYLANGLFESVEGQFSEWQLESGDEAVSDDTSVGQWAALTASVLVGAGITIYLAAPYLAAILITGLLAVLLVVFILIMRKAIVILLVIISPLAFASLMLPNTEGLFKKWKSLFISMLILFPVIGLLFGASSLASRIVQTAGAGGTEGTVIEGGEENDNSVILQISALAIMTIPLFATFPLLRGSLNATGKLGAKINDLGGKAMKGGYKGGDRLQQSGLAYLANRNPGRFGRRVGSLFSKGDGTLGGRGRRFAAAGAARQKEVGQQFEDRWDRDPSFDVAGRAVDLARDGKGEGVEFQAAISRMAREGDYKGLLAARAAMEGVELDGNGQTVKNQDGSVRTTKELTKAEDEAFKRALGSNFGAMKAKDPRITNGITSRDDNLNATGDFNWSSVKQSDMHGMKDWVIEAGMNSGDATFNTELEQAVNDPRQSGQFSGAIKDRVYDRSQRVDQLGGADVQGPLLPRTPQTSNQGYTSGQTPQASTPTNQGQAPTPASGGAPVATPAGNANPPTQATTQAPPPNNNAADILGINNLSREDISNLKAQEDKKMAKDRYNRRRGN